MQKKKLLIFLILVCVAIDAGLWWRYFATSETSDTVIESPADIPIAVELPTDPEPPQQSDEIIISTSEAIGEAPLVVSLAVASTLFTADTVTAVDWDFADEYALEGEGQNSLQVSHEFLFPGNYPVSVVITDNQGNSYITSVLIQVVAPGEEPEADVQLEA